MYTLKGLETPESKIHRVFEFMDPLKGESKAPVLYNVDAIFISKIEEVNWLLNIRALKVH